MVGRGCKRRNMNRVLKQMKVRLFPEEIIMNEILPRLPVKALIRFKSVCKRWHSTISSASFARLKLDKINPLDQNLLLLDMNFEKECVFYRVNPVEASENLMGKNNSKVLKTLPGRIRLYGACHGLVAFYSSFLGCCYIWNPSTGKQRQLLPVDSQILPSYEIVGFGYVSATHDYKLLVGSLKGYWYVYSTNDNRNTKNRCGWRKCLYYSNISPHERVPPSKQVGVLVGEKLYWKSSNFVICFDLASEEYSLIPIPRTMWGELRVSQLRPWSGSSWKQNRFHHIFDNSLLCTLGGCLSLCVVDDYVGTFSIWKLMDPQPNPDHSSLNTTLNYWSKVVTTWCNSGEYLSSREVTLFNPYVGVFEITDTGKFIMFTCGGVLLLCDPMCNVPNCIKLLAREIVDMNFLFGAINYVESPISPLDVC